MRHTKQVVSFGVIQNDRTKSQELWSTKSPYFQRVAGWNTYNLSCHKHNQHANNPSTIL